MCRFCHCTYDDLPHNIHKYGSKPHEIWTVDQYDSICRKLEENLSDSYGDTEAIEQMYSVQDDEYELEEIESDNCSDSDSEHDDFGVKNECVFNKLMSFHCVTSMPPDCLHDLFEGVLAQDLLGILRIFRDKCWFTLESYNYALKQFPLSRQESSNQPQPVPIQNKVKKLVGKAVSLWCHSRIFLTIISQNGWLDDPEDDVVGLAILLTDITQRITAEKFEEHEVYTLEELVIQYLDLRQILYEKFPCLLNPKPKHHFLSHYGESIRKFGPPLGYWTARYESKHRVAKSVAESAKNFKNISFTTSTRQQLRMASIYYHGMFPTNEFVLPSNVRKKSDLCSSVSDRLVSSLMEDGDLMCKEIVWKDRIYQDGCVVVIERKDLLEMTVGIIKCILIRGNNEVLFIVKRAQLVQTYLKSFKSKTVDEGLSLVRAVDLKDTYPLMKRGFGSGFYILPHHHVSFRYE